MAASAFKVQPQLRTAQECSGNRLGTVPPSPVEESKYSLDFSRARVRGANWNYGRPHAVAR